jgi:hypothetical protein
MLTGYVNPAETYIADPNQDVVYGLGFMSFEKEIIGFTFAMAINRYDHARTTRRQKPTRSAQSSSEPACYLPPMPRKCVGYSEATLISERHNAGNEIAKTRTG